MNSPDSNNSPEPIPPNSSLTPISEGNESAIEAEIVEDLSKSKKHPKERSLRIVRHSLHRREKQAIVSIVTISLPEGEYIAEAQRINPAQKPKPTWLDNFVTPWGIAGLLMLLSANILLSYAQWSSSQQVAQAPKPSKTIAPLENSPSLSIPDSLNLALENPDSLTLDSLSTIAPNTNIATTPIAPQQPIAATPTPTLSKVLLPPPAPPMAQLQPVQTVPPVQAYSAPPTAPIAPVSVPSQPPLPPPPVPQAANAMPANVRSPLETIPTFSNNSDRISEFSQRHMAEQKRQEMENLPPLSLNQKVRSDGFSRQYQLDPNRTRQQFQQRQREQIEQQLPIADDRRSSSNEIVIQQQPATTNREDIEQQLPPAPPQAQPLPNNSKPTVEMNNDGSVEIRSNSIR